MKTRLMPCTCKHEYQDFMYGNYMRVHNETLKKPTGAGGWACTVCGKVKSK